MSAYFSFMQGQDQEFIFEVTDEATIKKARDILAGRETSETHVMGQILMGQKPYNPNFSFHLRPESIRFFQMAIEVCDANMRYVEDHLDEAGGAFLPGRIWCPWDSRLKREVTVTH
ncbi:calmodulin [Pyxidicoccus fallax]|uniref:Calmodulin n=1 Tax=Pyxidicoccus fallax TaxID=394095 RepID=A0A848LK63_9BACT|nr:calmodulin [Pyxidicoccus fallax]NMO18100.1 calmodulin [Pyxidicoccus fallax]NPC80344.1 calmodulin [Pyxidicoccus fallax]